MKIGFIGLGNMGLNMVQNLMDHHHEVIAWNRSEARRVVATEAGVRVTSTLQELIQALAGEERRIIFSMISAGPSIDRILFENGDESIATLLAKEDIFIDGANSHYKDSVRRAVKLRESGILMLDAGISGGLEGARHGACAMVGGDEQAYKQVEQVFKDLCRPDGYGFFGTNGAGHYVKMVHNAIEYGMMQVIGEGMNLIYESDFDPDINKLLDVWNHGSIIESKLLNFLKKGLNKAGGADLLEAQIGSLGTGRWATEDALQRGVPFTSISHAVFNRYSSRGTGEIAFKMIQAMRAEFGAHSGTERDAQ